jgi:SAM-dependent methyltransferase
MIDDPDCPVCGAASWREIGSSTYTSGQAAGAKGWKKTAYRTLFEVWVPGEDRFTVRYRLCGDCGFVLYAPRPTAAEVAASYRLHAERVSPDGPRFPPVPRREALRARRLFNLVAPYLQSLGNARILDYGGGDGHLMERFVEKGASCHVLDYSGTAAPGVASIGRTEDDLPAEAVYDAVVCSHVVEHLVDPRAALAKLVAVLKDGGVMYVEVPVEIWGRAPRQSEPVTHLNFFTPGSLTRLLTEAGLSVAMARFANYPHPHGGWRMVASAIAEKRGARRPSPAPSGVAEVERLLNPSPRLRAWRRLLLARDVPHAAAQRLGRLSARLARRRSA